MADSRFPENNNNIRKSNNTSNTILAIIRLIYINIRAKVKKDFIILKAKLTAGLTQEHNHCFNNQNTINKFKNEKRAPFQQSKTQSINLKMRSGHRSNAAARACQP